MSLSSLQQHTGSGSSG